MNEEKQTVVAFRGAFPFCAPEVYVGATVDEGYHFHEMQLLYHVSAHRLNLAHVYRAICSDEI